MSVDTTGKAKRPSAAVRWLLALALVQTAALGFLALSLSNLGAKTDRLARSVALNAAPAPPGLAPSSNEVNLGDIRTIIREEVARLEPRLSEQTVTAAALPSVPAPSHAATAAAQTRIGRELESHIARGRMTSVEIEQFLTKAAELPPVEREQVMRKFMAAINSGKLDARF